MGPGAPQREQFGKYSVLRQLGEGGMSTVDLVEFRDRAGLPLFAALKRLSAAAATRKTLLQSFINEGRLTRYLRHPNIVETLESGNIGGTYYIAMEYVRGPTLKQLIDHCKETIGLLPIAIT